MTTVQLALVCCTVLAIAGLAVYESGVRATAAASTRVALDREHRGPDPGPNLTGRTLVVHTRKPDDQSVRGVVHAHHADRISLRDAVYLHATGEQAAGGLVSIAWVAVSTWQEITATTEPA